MPIIKVGPRSNIELQQIADALEKSRKVIVFTGAGISTNCGIPDFRSKDGLYTLIQNQYDATPKIPSRDQSDTFDIDNRPRKKRKKWYFEVVAPDGRVVDVIDDDLPPKKFNGIESRHCSSPRSSDGCNEKWISLSFSDLPIHKPDTARSIQSSSSLLDHSNNLHRYKASGAHEVTSSKPTEREESRNQKLNFKSEFSEYLSSEGSEMRLSCDYPLETQPKKDLSISTKSIRNNKTDTIESALESQSESSEIEVPLPLQSSQQSSRMIPNLKGRDLFDAMIWSDPFKASIFFIFMTRFREKVKLVKSTSETHRFFKVLRDSGRLVRTYTQNIDCLEEKVGLTTDLNLGPGNRARFQAKNQRVALPENPSRHSNNFRGVEAVLLHGSLGALRCGVCSRLCDWDEDNRTAITSKGTAPDCPHCTANNSKRSQVGRRSLTVGRLRPDIVLYGEEHPNSSLIFPLVTHDLSLGPDMLLIMGTSLKVHGVKVMIKEFAKSVHSKGGKVLFVNQTGPPESIWTDVIDYWINWDCDQWVLDLKDRRKDIWLPQGAVSKNNVKPRSKSHSTIVTRKKNKFGALHEDKSNGAYLVSKIMRSLSQAISELPDKDDKKMFKRRSFRSYTNKSNRAIKLTKFNLLPRMIEHCFSVKNSQNNLERTEAQTKQSDEPIASKTLSSYISKTWSKYWADFCEK